MAMLNVTISYLSKDYYLVTTAWSYTIYTHQARPKKVSADTGTVTVEQQSQVRHWASPRLHQLFDLTGTEFTIDIDTEKLSMDMWLQWSTLDSKILEYKHLYHYSVG